MAQTEITTSGKVIVSCDCGAVHTLTPNKETGEVITKSNYKKAELENPKTKKEEIDNGKESKTKSKFTGTIFDGDDE